MLDAMNNGKGGPPQNPVASLQQWGHQESIKIDLDSSIGRGGGAKSNQEETVDDLIRKLNDRGTKVKIVTANDEVAPEKGAAQADKENKPTGVTPADDSKQPKQDQPKAVLTDPAERDSSADRLREIEELQK